MKITPTPTTQKRQTAPNILDTEYLLQELFDLLQNDPKSAPRLLENLMNIDYDFETKEGDYKLLNQEQRKLFAQIHKRRKESEKFDQMFQFYLIILTGGITLGVGIVKLIEHVNERRDSDGTEAE